MTGTVRQNVRSAAHWFRSDIGRATQWMTVAYVLGYVAQGVYFLLLARTLGAKGLGVFAGALAIVSIAAPFAGLGSGQVLLMHTSRDRTVFQRYLAEALAKLAVSASLLIVLAVLASVTVLKQGGIGPLLIPLAFSELLFARILDLAAQCFQAHDRLRSAALTTLSLSVVRCAAIVLWLITPIVTTPLSWSWIYLGASAACSCAALGFAIARFGGPRRDGSRAGFRDLLTGIPFSVGTASKTIYGDIDKAMLVRLSTQASAGVYTAAYRVVFMAYAPIWAFLYSSNARFFRAGGSGSEGVWTIARRAWPASALYGAGCGVLMLASAPLMGVFLGHGYAHSVEALRWLSALPVIMATHSLFGDAMMGMGRQVTRSVLQLATAGVNVGLNIWLIPAFSWRGATIATYVCEIALAGALYLMLATEVRRSRAQRASHSRTMPQVNPSKAGG